jgi:hypothetical protein
MNGHNIILSKWKTNIRRATHSYNNMVDFLNTIIGTTIN